MADAIGDNLFILIFLLISFFSWLSGKIKERGEGSAPTFEQPEPTYQEQTEGRSSSAPNEDPMREILEALGIPTEQQAPPPLPREERPSPPTIPEPSKIVTATTDLLSEAERDALELIQSGQKPQRKRRQSGKEITARSMLSQKNLQAAFKLKEILDKPKSLRALDH